MRSLFVLFTLWSYTTLAQEIVVPLHVLPGKISSYRQAQTAAKSADDTVRYIKFPSVSLPFLDDFSSNKFFGYSATELNCTDTYDFVKFLVDNDFMETFTGTQTPTSITTHTQDAQGNWTTSTLPQPSYQVTFFSIENPTTPDSTATYYIANNRTDSIYFSSEPRYIVTEVPSETFTNEQFVLKHCDALGNPLWKNYDVYLNNNFAVMPPTLGVVSFDGADSSGIPYEWSVIPNYFPYGKADVLESAPINLSGLTTADSVYLSFFMQPQGRGANAPEEIDSLLLQFKLPTSDAWKTVWYSQGFELPDDNVTANTSRFTFQSIRVDSVYFSDKFQFRFMNYATLTGALDVWHIDMVRLDKARSAYDSVYSDAGFVYPNLSLLREYQTLPYPHYTHRKLQGFDMLQDTLYPFLHNQNDVQMNLTLRATITEPSGTLQVISPISSNNLSPFTYCQIGKTCINQGDVFNMNPVNYEYPAQDGVEEAEFEYAVEITSITNDFIAENNRATQVQSFKNYYAYDDGSAENGYGLNVLNGEIAMRFKLYKADTLRAVAMYFDPQTINFFSENSPYLFDLKVWIGSDKPEVLIYQKDSLRPMLGTTDFFTRKNDFAYYFLDSLMYIDTGGYVFVGWQQRSAQVYGIGFDRNTNANNNMFFDIKDGNGWYSSQLPGSWMIRPCFGKAFDTPVDVQEPTQASAMWNVYPNPSSGLLTIRSSEKIASLTMFDMVGNRVLHSLPVQSTLDVSALPNGTYLLSVQTESGAFLKPKRMVINR